MYCIASKTSVVIICGATTAVVLTIGFWVKYYRSRTKKEEYIEENTEGDECEEPIENVISDVAELETEDSIDDKSEELIDRIVPKEWSKIGHIQELFIYPLKSGRGKLLKDSLFTDYGISVINDDKFQLRDRMFLVYKEETGEFRTGRNYPTMVLVTLTAVDKNHVKLDAVGMPNITFEVPTDTASNATPIPCTLWWGEPFECLDCGSEVARWISRFLTGTNSGLRLGCALGKKKKNKPWEKFEDVCNTLRQSGTGLSSDLASYMVMSESSVRELNQKLDRPGPALQFRPNIVVSGPEPFAEDNWEWIKIGENVLLRNVKPYSSFREQRNPHRIQVDGKSASMGIYCCLYRTGGVKVGDEVWVDGDVKSRSRGPGDVKFESERFLRKEAEMDVHNAVGNGL